MQDPDAVPLWKPSRGRGRRRRRRRWRWRWSNGWAAIAGNAAPIASASRQSDLARAAGAADDRHNVNHDAQGLARHVALVESLRDRLIAINQEYFAGVHHRAVSAEQIVADFHAAFLDLDHGCFVVVVHCDIERGASHRDHRYRRNHTVRIRYRAEMLDVHPNFPQEQIDQVAPVARVLPEHETGIRINLDGAAVGDLQYGVAVRA